jgi:hypothetical protein
MSIHFLPSPWLNPAIWKYVCICHPTATPGGCQCRQHRDILEPQYDTASQTYLFHQPVPRLPALSASTISFDPASRDVVEASLSTHPSQRDSPGSSGFRRSLTVEGLGAKFFTTTVSFLGLKPLTSRPTKGFVLSTTGRPSAGAADKAVLPTIGWLPQGAEEDTVVI